MNLYVVRHGETYLNRYNRMQGWADSPLTEEGKEIAIEAGKRLSTVHFDRVYTSDSGRTVETAELILQQNHHSSHLIINRRKAFREVFFGSFEGEDSEVAWSRIARENGFETFSEMLQSHGIEEIINFMGKSDPCQHAETYHELWERLETGLREIVSEGQRDNENVLLVTHGVVIRSIISKFSGEFNHEVEIKNSSVSVLEYASDVFNVVSFNQ